MVGNGNLAANAGGTRPSSADWRQPSRRKVGIFLFP